MAASLVWLLHWYGCFTGIAAKLKEELNKGEEDKDEEVNVSTCLLS